MTKKMKDSGIEWIGEIPEDWEVIKIKHLFNVSRGRVISKLDLDIDGKYPVFSSQTENNGIFGYLDTYDYTGEALTWTTDGEKAGTVFYRNGKYNCTNICGILQKKETSIFNTDIKFLYYAIRMVAEENKRPDTNGHKIMSNEMEKLSIPIANYETQKKIGIELDNLILKINDTSKIISQQIELLENYKKSVITEAVTKGLDKNVEMKDSGIEWIGEIPKHWDVIPLKYLISYNQKTLTETTRKDYEFEYIDIGSVEYGKGILPLEVMTFEKAPSRARRIVRTGDIIISTVRTYLKAIAIVPESDRPLIASTGFMVISSGGILEQDFLNYSVQSEYFVSEISSRSKGVNYPAINSSDLINIKILVPKKIERQEITDYLDKKTKLIDDSITLKQKQLETLEEYKKSLIYEYVTGKKEVTDGEGI